MKPNVSETRDPLNVRLVPASADRMELNYRTSTNPAALPHAWMITSSAVLHVLHLFGLRLVLQFQSAGLTVALVAAVGMFLLATSVAMRRRGNGVMACFLALAAPVFVLTLLTPASPVLLWVGVLFALALTVWLATAFIHHAAAWYSADLRVAIPLRRRFLAAWNPRSFHRPLREPNGVRSDVRLRESQERAGIHNRLVLVGLSGAASLALQVLFADDPSDSFVIMLGFVGVLGVIAIRSIWSFCEQTGRPLRLVAADIHRGVVIWFGYNSHATQAPGVMLSPAGPAWQRGMHFWVTFAVFCAACGPASSYFAGSLRAAGERARWSSSSGEQPGSFSLGREVDTRIDKTAARAVSRLHGPIEGRILIGFVADVPRRWPALVFALAGSALFPPLAFMLALYAICARTLAHFGATFGAPSPYLRNITEWHAAVERLRQSRDRLESEHIWLGVAVQTDSPVIMHRQLTAEHVHLLGSTGSNKTSVGVTQLLEQLIGADASLLVLDLKGDMALFEAARFAASNVRDRGADQPINFRWFTTESDRSTFVFNPLSQTYLQRLPRLERTQILSRALGLEHGEGYGRGHFSTQNRNALLKLLTVCPEVDSFRKLHEEGRRQKKLFTTWEREHASDFFSAIHTLANIDALNVTARDRVDPAVLSNAIDMSELIREPTIAYFRLPATSQAAANREVGKLALYGLLTAVRQLGRANRQIYIVIDEFQQLVSADLAIILQQARSYGIGVIMAHQTQSDLKLPETDMTQVVEENTHFKQIFSVNDLGHRQALEALSGEALYHLAGWDQGSESYEQNMLYPGAGLSPLSLLEEENVKITPSIGPRLRANDLIEMSARPNLCMVQFKRNVGYGQYDGFPFLMRADYHITRRAYLARLSAPWPPLSAAPGLILTPLSPDCFFYQIGVEKPSMTQQAPLPFIDSPASPGLRSPSAPATNTPPSAGETIRPAPDRNPIVEALDSL